MDNLLFDVVDPQTGGRPAGEEIALTMEELLVKGIGGFRIVSTFQLVEPPVLIYHNDETADFSQGLILQFWKGR